MLDMDSCGNHSENRKSKQGFFARLRANTSGNTLAIVGAALIPLTAMIGSGVDMSRAYMAKTRLQSACDSAALAGRRVMVNDSLGTNVTPEAIRYFNFNFPQGMYQTAAFTPTVTRPSAGTVRVAASTTIPTAVMRIFGFTSLPLSVDCDASLNFVNTDVMLVLDVTGSMDSELSGVRKIVSMRDAVMALYDELAPIQTQLEANGLRLRYGVVPYSTTVNVGSLIRDVNPAFLASASEYETRVAVYDTPATFEGIPGTEDPPVEQVHGSSISQSQCDRYGQNTYAAGPNWGGGPEPTPYWTRTYSNNEGAGQDWGWAGAADTSGDNRSCRRRYVQRDATVTSWKFTRYSYQQESVDTSNFRVLGTAVNYAVSDPDPDIDGPGGTVPDSGTYDMVELAQIGTGIYTSSATWSGCIEERDTVNTITSASGYAIPSGAYDLQANYVPDSELTRWRPMWRTLTYRRSAGTAPQNNHDGLMDNAPCPAAARRLQAWTRANLLTYVNGLNPTGNTYHDSGMIWGARLLSNSGPFPDSPDSFASMPVARHIIFMTDGVMDTDNGIYGLYGIERNSQRISGMGSPSETELNSRHMQRFKMMCNAAKSMNASIWVIAFGSTLQPHLLECASNANQASVASDRATLIARFREIGSNIGALRLTQ